jgi:putative transcriptional regulator
MKLGNHIRRYRFENGDISQETLASEVGVTRQTIHSIEKNKFVPSTLLAFKIARFFNCKVEDIFYLTNSNII